MRWKAFFYNKQDDKNIPETYGLKSLNCPPQIKELIPFEKDLFELIKVISFRNIKSNFQDQIKEDIRLINNSKKTLTFADKTANMYRLTKDEYNKFLNDAITTTYKKVNNNVHDKIINGGKNY